MAVLGAGTLWAGLASWRRNSRAGLHQHDRGVLPPTSAVDDINAPGTPGVVDRPEAPHRRRRRRRPAADGD
jgi:hypothetical protein